MHLIKIRRVNILAKLDHGVCLCCMMERNSINWGRLRGEMGRNLL